MLKISVVILTILFLLPGVPSPPPQGESEHMSHPTIYLHFKWGSFDPLEGPAREAEDLSFTPDSLVVVQFTRPPYGNDRETLEEYGFLPLLYQPDYAFISIETPGATPPPGVRAIYPLKAYLRASPDLIQEYERGEKEAKRLFVLLAHPSPSSIIYLSQVSYVEEAGVDYCVVRAAPRDLKYILKAPLLLWVEELGEVGLDNNVASDIIDVNEVRGSLNLTGRGVIVAVADTGLDNGRNDNTMHPDFRGRIRAAHAWGRSGNWSDADIHINNSGVITYKGGHGTHVAGSVLGNGTASNGTIKGMAPEAYLVIQSLMTSTGSLAVPSNYTLLFSQAYSDGARIHTNSWSSRSTSTYGNYTTRSYYIDYYTWLRKNFTILYSAGNQQSYGNGSVSTQATSKNCIAVGASENYRPNLSSYANNASELAYFSSLGPTDDGRIKPDVVAPGTWILSTRSTLISDPWNHYWGSQSLYSSLNSYYAYNGGTSMSTPITAGSVALLRQYMVEREGHDPSSALLKALLINGARPLSGNLSSIPNNREGWGRINLTLSLGAAEGMKLTWVDCSPGLNTSSTYSKRIVVQNSSTPLFVTLVWTDYPASPTSSIALVNDLDLEVVLPNGTVYYGNDFSSPFNSTHDRRNNVERVHIEHPSTGIYTIRVRGYSVPYGPQPFAIAITANTTDAIGTLRWEKPFYRAGEWGRLILSDSNLTGRGWVRIFVNSTADPTGEWVNLTENSTGGAQGIFEGRVRFVLTSPGRDEVRVGDNATVVAYYNESYPRRTLTASIKAYVQPVIAWVNHTAWNYIVTGGETTTILLNGTPGREAFVRILNLSGGLTIQLYDDGRHGDGLAGDGTYSGNYTVPSTGYLQGNFTIEGHLKREPLSDTVRYCPHPLRIDTFMPRRPSWLNVTPLPEGGALHLRWEAVPDPNLLSYRIYRNTSGGDFTLVHETLNTTPAYVDRGLTDGVRYTYYVLSRNIMGRLSRPSPLASGVPEDTLPPSLRILNPGEGDVLNGVVEVNYTADNDTVWVALDIYRDLNSNGVADDGEGWYEAANASSSPGSLRLDTRSLPEDFEGISLLLRLRGEDEAGNAATSPLISGVRIDNTPPEWVQILPGREAVTSTGEVTFTILTEPSATIQLSSNRSLPSFSYAEGPPGNYTLHLTVLPGSTLITVYVYDAVGNGPLSGGPVTVHYDPFPPICSFVVEGANTTEGLRLHSTSSDPSTVSNTTLVGIARLLWNVSYQGEYFRGEGEDLALLAPYPGWAQVTLTVWNLFGNMNSTTERVRINDTTPPSLPQLGPFTFEEDRRFTLSAEGCTDNDPSFYDGAEFIWNISGTVYWGFYISAVLTSPGEYTATLTAVDPSGNSNTTYFRIKVLDTTPPSVAVEGPPQIRAGVEVIFSAENTTDNDPLFAPGENILWEVVEMGLEGRGATFSVTFPRRGSYTLRVTVFDPSGNNATSVMTLVVLSDGTPPQVLRVEVREVEGYIDPTGTFTVHFSEPLTPPSPEAVHLLCNGREVEKSMKLSSDGLLLNITLFDPLPKGSQVTLSLTSAIEDLTGTPLHPNSFNFTVWGELEVLNFSPARVNSSGEVRLTFSNKLTSVEGATLRLGEKERELPWQINGRNITVTLPEAPPGEGTIIIHRVVDIFGQNLTEVEVPYSVPPATSHTEGGGGGGGGAIYIYLISIIIAAAALLTAAVVRRKKRA